MLVIGLHYSYLYKASLQVSLVLGLVLVEVDVWVLDYK